MLLPSVDDVCNLKYQADFPEKFLENFLSVFPLTVDNCFELVFFLICAKFVNVASRVIRSMFCFAVVNNIVQNY